MRPAGRTNETAGVATPATVGGTYTTRGNLQLTVTDDRGDDTLYTTYFAGSEQPSSMTAAAG